MTFINRVISVFNYEVVKIKKNRIYLTTLLILPFVTILFFGVMFYEGAIEKLPIVVVDNDNSPMSRKLLSMISATRSIEIAEYAPSINIAEESMRRGDTYAILLIPHHFERDIYAMVPTSVECYISATNLSASGVIESAAQSTLQTFSAGISISKLMAKGIDQHDAILEVMPINFHSHIISNPTINYGYYLAPIFMYMSLAIFTILLSVYAIGNELYYSTAKNWMQLANNNVACATLGKLLPTTIVMSLYSQLILLVLFIIMGMQCNGSYLLLSLGSLLFIVAYQAVAVVIVSITSNMRLSLSLGGGYAVMAFTFSGITFPRASMFVVARYLSYAFPLTWFSDIFVDQAMRGAPIIYSMPAILSLLIFALTPLLVRRRLRGISLIPKYWGRD